MYNKLKELIDNSYSPYSKFKVAAIAVTVDNKEFNGVNIENASYGATICAERSAISSAISSGYKKGDIKEMHIMVDTDKISTCCFLCRQVIVELMNEESKVICYNNLGDNKEFKVKELCPYPFSQSDLE